MGKKGQAESFSGKGKPANKGQWKKGQTGNPKGRPPKKPAEPLSFVGWLGASLADEITVVSNGNKQTLPMGEYIAKAVINGIAKAQPKDMLTSIEKLNKLGAFEAMAAADDEYEDEGEPMMSTEARRLLAITIREMEGRDEFEEGSLGFGDDGGDAGPL